MKINLASKLPRVITFVLMVSCAAASLSMTWPRSEDILDERDRMVEEEFWDRPTMHSLDNRFQSFLRWHCFAAEELTTVGCFDEEGKAPRKDEEGNDWGAYDFVVVFQSEARELYFELHHMINPGECLQSLELFNKVRGIQGVCMYAVPWPNQIDLLTDFGTNSSDSFRSYGFKGINGRYLAPTFDPDSEAFIGDQDANE